LAGSQRMPTPQYFVSDAGKEAMAGQLVAQTIFGMERLAEIENAPLSDDFIDILARAAGAVLAMDTNLKTPGKRRLAAETVAVHVLRHLNRYRAEEAETGHFTFLRMLAENEIPEAMKKSWNDS